MLRANVSIMCTTTCPAPIVILGNQKTGKTAISAKLDMHIPASITFNMPTLWYREENIILNGNLEQLVDQYSACFLNEIIKKLWLTSSTRELIKLFLDDRYNLIIRDVCDYFLGNMDRSSLPGDRTENPSLLPDFSRNWKEIIDQ